MEYFLPTAWLQVSQAVSQTRCCSTDCTAAWLKKVSQMQLVENQMIHMKPMSLKPPCLQSVMTSDWLSITSRITERTWSGKSRFRSTSLALLRVLLSNPSGFMEGRRWRWTFCTIKVACAFQARQAIHYKPGIHSQHRCAFRHRWKLQASRKSISDFFRTCHRVFQVVGAEPFC